VSLNVNIKNIAEIKLQKQKLVALKQSKQANIHQETQQRATLLSDLLRILQSMLNKWSETYTQKAIFDAVEFGRLLLGSHVFITFR
jgi:hypothetical protein